MKLHKTPQSQRNTYTYQFYDADGNPEPRITIQPGENGVTEVDIKRLHALDDSEVYYNIKSRRPEENDTLKAQRAVWREHYISDFIRVHGYEPHEQDVVSAVNEAFPKGWVASLDELLDGDDEHDGYGDKSSVFATLCLSNNSGKSPQVECLYALIADLPEKEQEIFRRVLLDGERKCNVAADLSISDVRVSQITKKIQRLISDEKILQSFFR